MTKWCCRQRPTIISALKINVGMSWVGVMWESSWFQKQDWAISPYMEARFSAESGYDKCSILLIAAALMYQGVAWLEKKYLRWRQ